ncbi:phytoene desaturase [Stappia sp. ES.058]|uniref:phytoene desaturase n=1 Tax=Stappia sp. ES.058 TaxID=1881061 RepID=UPI00087A8960|nr:phytoene desaturase [Stappia sp. ES.058]SDT96522.1 phytoene desaturase [Stappia sp. ES.058]
MTIHPTPVPAITGDDSRAHAVVIGAGVGGLAAAIRLSVRGYRVTVVDRLDAPGGRASVFRQDGFTFDAGPTILTAPFLFEELWTLCGQRMSDHVTLRELTPCYTIRFDDGDAFRCYGDTAAMRAEVERFSPADLAGYDAFLKESKACFHIGFEKMVDRPFPSLASMAKALPDLVLRRAERSVHALVSKHVRNDKLRMALSFHPLFIGGNPMRTSSLMSLISYLEQTYGVHYANGGTGALVRGMADLAESQGVAFRMNADVTQILVDNGRANGVRLADDEQIEADIVVSNADAAWTYGKLLPASARGRWSTRKLGRMAYSMSLFVWYFGTDRQYPEVGHHTVMMGPRYDGLLADIFDRKILADDFSLYLHRPSATDPSVAPEGCDTFYVLSPVPNLDGATDWRQAAEPYRARIEAHLERTMLPGLGDALVTSRVMTPLDFQTRLLAHKGAAFGMEPRLTQLAWFRPHNASEAVDGLYLVGAGTHPGAGLPGVVASAKILDKVVPHAREFA